MSAVMLTDATRQPRGTVVARLTLTGLAFAVCYLFVYIVPINALPALSGALGSIVAATGVTLAMGAGWLAWTLSYRAQAGLLSRVLLGAAIGGVVAFAASALTGPLLYVTKPNHGVLVGLYLAAPLGTLTGGVIGAMSWARRRWPRTALMWLVLAVVTTVACGSGQSNDRSRPESSASSTDPTEFLLTSAAADFRAQNAPRPVSFRNVRSGYLASEGVRQDRLCGEYLPASGNGKVDWVPFVTIRTSAYEQWLGGQALDFCRDTAMKWEEGDLSSRLLSRFSATQ